MDTPHKLKQSVMKEFFQTQGEKIVRPAIIAVAAVLISGFIVFASVKRPAPKIIPQIEAQPEFHTTSNRAILDAADATDRLMQFGRRDTLIEATRLYQVAKRESMSDKNFLALMYYFNAASLYAQIGDDESRHRAEVCGAEVRGRGYNGAQPGECEALAKQASEKLSRK